MNGCRPTSATIVRRLRGRRQLSRHAVTLSKGLLREELLHHPNVVVAKARLELNLPSWLDSRRYRPLHLSCDVRVAGRRSQAVATVAEEMVGAIGPAEQIGDVGDLNAWPVAAPCAAKPVVEPRPRRSTGSAARSRILGWSTTRV